MSEKIKIKWLEKPDEHDYPATSFLRLLFDEKTAAKYVHKLEQARVSKFKAKDIIRVSSLSLLGVSGLTPKSCAS